jgi:hypothetical protein
MMSDNFIIRRLIETFAFLRAHLLEIAKFFLLLYLPVIVIELALSHYIARLVPPIKVLYFNILINYLYQPLYTGGFIYLISKTVSGERWGFKKCLVIGLTCWGNLLVVNVISSIAIFAGLIAFIIPGLIAFARLSLSEYGVVLDGLDFKEAMIRSVKITKAFTWHIIGSSMLLFAILLLIKLLMQKVIAEIALDKSIFVVVSSLVSVILWSNFTILLFRFYDLAKRGAWQEPYGS